MKLIVNKKTGRVINIAKKANGIKFDKDKFEEITKTLTPAQEKKINGHYATFYKKEKLEFQEFGFRIRKPMLEDIRKEMEDAKGIKQVKDASIKLINLLMK